MTSTSRAYLYLVLAAPFGLFLAYIFYAATLEDAQITIRYSLRLAEGYDFGMWNRTGAPVEGFTSGLWMILLSLFGPDVDRIAHGAKILGISTQLLVILLFFRGYLAHLRGDLPGWSPLLAQRETAAQAFLFTALYFCLSVPYFWYSSSGMETIPFSCLIALAVFGPLYLRSSLLIISIAIVLTAMRPEGVLFAVATSIYFAAISREWKFGIAAVASLAVFGAIIWFRLQYFGHFMPNTYYAKSGDIVLFHILHGGKYFIDAFAYYFYFSLPIIGFAAYSLIRRKMPNPFLIIAIVGAIAYFLLILKSGGDNKSAFPLWRHYMILLPLIAFCAFFIVGGFARRGMPVLLLVAAIAPFILDLRMHIINMHYQVQNLSPANRLANFYSYNSFVHWMAENVPEDAVVSTSLAGQIPLLVDAEHIDVLGLNDAAVAHSGSFDPNGPVDSKSNMQSVLERRPDIIEAYFPPEAALDASRTREIIFSRRTKMHLELIENPYFQENYLLITNVDYSTGFARALFVHREFQARYGAVNGYEVQTLDTLLNGLKAP